jgi:hypothetical protein
VASEQIEKPFLLGEKSTKPTQHWTIHRLRNGRPGDPS